jgi:RNA recognition motif-containing protein
MIMNIYIGNLSFGATDKTIRQAFEAFGQVTSAKVIKDRYTGRSRGFAFVKKPVEYQAHAVIKSLNGKEITGKQIIVQPAHDSAGMGRQGGRMDNSKSKDRY